MATSLLSIIGGATALKIYVNPVGFEDLSIDLLTWITSHSGHDPHDLFSYLGIALDIGQDITYPHLDPPSIPTMTSFSTMDSFLAGSDVVIIGGPIVNNAAIIFQNSTTIAQPALSDIGLHSVSFSTGGSLNGNLFGASAPQLTVVNATTTTYSRSLLGSTVTDYAVIVGLQSVGGRNCLYTAGIREFGTKLLAYMIEAAINFGIGPSTWHWSDPSTVAAWRAAFSSNSAFVISFTYPDGIDNIIGSPNNFLSRFLQPPFPQIPFPIPVTIIPI